MAKQKIDPIVAFKQRCLERSIDEMEQDAPFIPFPPTTYSIGQVVSGATILDTKYDSRYYLIETSRKTPFSPQEVLVKEWVSWLNLRKPPVLTDSLIPSPSYIVQPFHYPLSVLLSILYSSKVDFQPPYHRVSKWQSHTESALIDSIFRGFDIGTIVLAQEGNSYTVVDGASRLLAIAHFYEDRLTYQGYTFSQLSLRDQAIFTNHIVNVLELRHISLAAQAKMYFRYNSHNNTLTAAERQVATNFVSGTLSRSVAS